MKHHTANVFDKLSKILKINSLNTYWVVLFILRFDSKYANESAIWQCERVRGIDANLTQEKKMGKTNFSQYFESINKISTIQMDLIKMNVRMKFYDQYEKKIEIEFWTKKTKREETRSFTKHTGTLIYKFHPQQSLKWK